MEVIDTWEMTSTDLGIFSGSFRVPPAREGVHGDPAEKSMKKGHQHSPLVALFKIRGPKQRDSDCGIFPDGSQKW